jgi:hypothetical protein
MKHIRKLLKETAAAGATTAGGIAGVRGVLFSKPIKRQKEKNIKVQRIVFHNDARGLRESLLNSFLKETEEGRFKAIDVISKLNNAQRDFNFEKHTVAFGVEDDNGQTVKVYVRANQADQFEKTLSEILYDKNEDPREVAEILFNLKDKFEIVHVDWGEVEEDEEEVPARGAEGTDNGNQSLSLDDTTGESPGMNDNSGDLDMGDGDQPPDESEATSVLDKVIAMLKADAEARTAEAKAKEAEYNSKEAEFAAKTAEAKIKGEEEILNMEDFFKKQNDEKKEAQKLAKLARYRHEKAASVDDDEYDDYNNDDYSYNDRGVTQ